MDEITAYKNAIVRERKAREESENILEEKTRELFIATQDLRQKYDEIQTYLSESDLLFNLSKIFHGNASTDVGLQYFIDGICQVRKWSIGHIYLTSKDENGNVVLQPSSIWFFSDKSHYQEFYEITMQHVFKPGFGFPGRIYQTKEPHWIENVFTDGNFPRSKSINELKILGAFGVPIMCYQEVIAIAEFYSDSNITHDQRMLSWVVTAANQLGMMLERQHNEQQLVNNYRELEKVYKELQNTQVQLVQHSKMASIGELAAGVAHEINNPIGFVMSNVEIFKQYFSILNASLVSANEMLQKKDSDDRLKWQKLWQENNLDFILKDSTELLDDSIEGLKRVIDIVKSLKTFSHAQVGEKQEVDINFCIESTLKVIHNELKYKCTVHKYYGQIPLIYCFPTQISQVIMNLLVNASQAIHEKGEIYIFTECDQKNIIITITDTGAGIKTEDMNKLFDPFFTTKPVGQGTGLGLSISYNIIQNHGGHIEVSSKLNQGTSFVIYLPIESESAHASGDGLI